MKYEEIIERFASESRIEDEDEAERILQAILDVMEERIPRTERHDLAAELPAEVSRHLETGTEATVFALEDFYNRVKARAEIGYPAAVRYTRAAVTVLKGAVSAGQMEDVREALGSEYAELFGPDEPVGGPT